VASQFNVMVAVKRVVDYAVCRLTIDRVEMENIKHSINLFDEIAIEVALSLKEDGRDPPNILIIPNLQVVTSFKPHIPDHLFGNVNRLCSFLRFSFVATRLEFGYWN